MFIWYCIAFFPKNEVFYLTWQTEGLTCCFVFCHIIFQKSVSLTNCPVTRERNAYRWRGYATVSTTAMTTKMSTTVLIGGLVRMYLHLNEIILLSSFSYVYSKQRLFKHNWDIGEYYDKSVNLSSHAAEWFKRKDGLLLL